MASFRTRFLDSLLNEALPTKLTPDQRSALARGIAEAERNEPPPTLVLIGESGVGKTSTINALFNAGQKVGATRATTQVATSMTVDVDVVQGSRGMLRVVDMPGLGDDIANYPRYLDLYSRVLPTADAILWVHAAEDRSVQLIQQAVHELFVRRLPHLAERVVFGLNKADAIAPFDWNPVGNVPSRRQSQHLQERERDFTEKIRAAMPTWRPNATAVAYSAKQRYQLPALFKQMIFAVPEQRRWVLESRMDLADFFELVDKGMLKAAQERTPAPSPIVPSPAGAQPTPTPPPAEPPTPTPPPAEPPTPTAMHNDDRVQQLAEMPAESYEALVSDRHTLLRWLRRGPQ